jgi:cytosine/adenosine deaminase-related metal-dependent hydrolase
VKYQLMTEADIINSTRLGISESLKAGITTVGDMSDFEPALAALHDSPLKGIFYWEVFGVEMEQALKTWTGLKALYPALQDQYGSDRLRIGVSPHACYTVRPELYSWIAEWAMSEKIPISFHLSESKAEEQFIGQRSGPIQKFLESRAGDWTIKGPTSVAHIEQTGILGTQPLLAHLVQVNSNDVAILHRYNVAVAHCPKSNAKFGHGVAPMDQFLQSQLCVGIGTDSAASNNRLDLFEEARFALFQHRQSVADPALTEQRLLAMMTIEGARALQLENQTGSLEAGKAADMIEVQIPKYYTNHSQVLHHLIYNTTAADVLKTFIDGKEVNVEDVSEDLTDLYKKLP